MSPVKVDSMISVPTVWILRISIACLRTANDRTSYGYSTSNSTYFSLDHCSCGNANKSKSLNNQMTHTSSREAITLDSPSSSLLKTQLLFLQRTRRILSDKICCCHFWERTADQSGNSVLCFPHFTLSSLRLPKLQRHIVQKRPSIVHT